MQPRISMITLGVSDLAKSIHFYEVGLGFPRMDSPPEVAFFTLNGTWLGLFSRVSLAEDAQVPHAGTGFKGFSLSHNVASQAEVDAVFAQAIAAGATPTKQPQKSSGAATAVISRTRTATSGKLHITPTSGSAQLIQIQQPAK